MKSSSEQSPSVVRTKEDTSLAAGCQVKSDTHKWCPKCGEWKDKSEFYLKDGYPVFACKQCYRIVALTRYYKSEYAKGAKSRKLQRERKQKKLQRQHELKQKAQQQVQQRKMNSISKICSTCGKRKAKAMYYRNRKSIDGLTSICKSCSNLKVKEWQRDNREYQKERNKKWKKANPDKARQADTRAKAKHRRRHPGREKARQVVTRAREHGLVLGSCCWPNCTATEKIEAAHDDYSKPHLIYELCHKHHNMWDYCKGELPFDLPVIDISIYLKPSGQGRPRKELQKQIGVGV